MVLLHYIPKCKINTHKSVLIWNFSRNKFMEEKETVFLCRTSNYLCVAHKWVEQSSALYGWGVQTVTSFQRNQMRGRTPLLGRNASTTAPVRRFRFMAERRACGWATPWCGNDIIRTMLCQTSSPEPKAQSPHGKPVDSLQLENILSNTCSSNC